MKINFKQKVRSLKEPLIVWGVMVGIFLPARLIFVHFIGNNWIGSLGLSTAIAIILIILTKRNKLGWFGVMFVNQVGKRLKKGKLKKLIYGESFFWIISSSYILLAIHYGDIEYTNTSQIWNDSINSMAREAINLGFNNNSPEWQNWIITFIVGITGFVNHFPLIANMVHNLNNQYHGWLATLYTVILFQQIETFGIIQLYRKTLISR